MFVCLSVCLLVCLFVCLSVRVLLVYLTVFIYMGFMHTQLRRNEYRAAVCYCCCVLVSVLCNLSVFVIWFQLVVVCTVLVLFSISSGLAIGLFVRCRVIDLSKIFVLGLFIVIGPVNDNFTFRKIFSFSFSSLKHSYDQLCLSAINL